MGERITGGRVPSMHELMCFMISFCFGMVVIWHGGRIGYCTLPVGESPGRART